MTSKTATAAQTPAGSALYYPIMVVLVSIAFVVPLHLGYQVTAAAEGLYGFLSGLAVAATAKQYVSSARLNFDYVLMTGLCFCLGATLVMTYPQDQTTLAWMVTTGTVGLVINTILRFIGITAPPSQTL